MTTPRQDVATRGAAAGRAAFMVCIAAAMLLPFALALATSLQTLGAPNAGTFLPWPLSLDNYVAVLRGGFGRFMLNSAIVAFCSIAVVLFVSIHAGYVVARYEFRGKNLLLFAILCGMALGELSAVVPLYFFGSRLGLLDTYVILVLANSAFIAPLAIWFLQGYFRSIPVQLDEAALIDGTGRLGALYRVVLPAAKPGLVTVSLLAFIGAWNEVLLALVLTSSEGMRTAPVALHFFMTDYGVQWGPLTAAAVLTTLPVLILFLLLQRHFVRGLTAGATTGL
jgi:ABC-type glycerol-3-phosphate transport system permease component